MTSFNVIPEMVAGAGARLGGMSGAISDIQDRVGSCSGAAAGTPVDSAMEGLLGQWATLLPVFGLAGDRLSGAVLGASQAYAGTDAAIAETSGTAAGAA